MEGGPGPGDDVRALQLKLVQLDCIVAAQNREMQIMRQAVHDQANGTEEVIEELHKENTQLRTLLSDKERELQRARALALGADAAAAAAAMGQQQHGGTDSYSNGDTDLESNWHADDEEEGAAAHAAAANGGVPVPPAPPQSRPRRAWPLPSHESLVTLADGGTSDAGDSVASGASLGTKPAAAAHGAADEVLALNVSGVELHVLRSTLLLAPSSHLAAIFRQGSDCPPPHDTHGRPFLPFEPASFGAVIEALQALQLLGLHPSATNWRARLREGEPYFRRLVAFLGLQYEFYELAAPAAATAAAPVAAAVRSGSGSISMVRSASGASLAPLMLRNTFDNAMHSRTSLIGGAANGRGVGSRTSGLAPPPGLAPSGTASPRSDGRPGNAAPAAAAAAAAGAAPPSRALTNGVAVAAAPTAQRASSLGNGGALRPVPAALPAAVTAALRPGPPVSSVPASSSSGSSSNGSAAPSTSGAAPGPLPDAVLAALRPLSATPAHASGEEPSAGGTAPARSANTACEAALRGLKVPNMYMVMQQKSAAAMEQ